MKQTDENGNPLTYWGGKQYESKPHGFCETPEENCTMNYCDENGCQNRKRELVEPTTPDFIYCDFSTLADCEAVKNWDSFVEQKNKEILAEEYANNKSSSEVFRDAHKKDFMAGYDKAKETLYTEEQMELCWISAMSNRAGFSDSIGYTEFIKSLNNIK